MPRDDFSLVLGGPLYRLYLRTRLARPPLELLRRRILVLVAVTLLPPALLSALTGHLATGPAPFLLDLTNLQFVTTLPLLLASEPLVHRRMRPLVSEFVVRDLVAAEDRPRFDEIVAGTVRLRDSVVAEIVLVLVAFAGGYWLWRSRLTLPGCWLAFVSLPISRFILLRWYFRLFVWYALLWRVSRLRLRLNALHADRAGGLGFLAESVVAFTPVLVAQSIFFATVLGNRIWHGGARLSDFTEEIAAVMAFLVLVVLLPLTFFAARLMDTRLHGTRRYGQLASHYANAFEAKWLAGRSSVSESERLLGTSDIQSLSDLANSYEVARRMRLVPFEKTAVVRLAIFIGLPLLPLTFTMVPLEKLLVALFNVFV